MNLVSDMGSMLTDHSGKTFLRENCRCPECTHPDTMQRIVDTFKVGVIEPL